MALRCVGQPGAMKMDALVEGDSRLHSRPEHKLIRDCEAGAVFLRVRSLYEAIASFERGMTEDTGSRFEMSTMAQLLMVGTVDQVVDAVLSTCRKGLAHLAAEEFRVITLDEAEQLDKLTQNLLKGEIERRWPRYGVESQELGERLGRKSVL